MGEVSNGFAHLIRWASMSKFLENARDVWMILFTVLTVGTVISMTIQESRGKEIWKSDMPGFPVLLYGFGVLLLAFCVLGVLSVGHKLFGH